MNRHRVFGLAASVVVVIALAMGFANLGGRKRQRDIRTDEQRSQDLNRIASTVDLWYARDKKLPPDLNALSRYQPGLRVRDPITNAAYEYKPAGDTQYDLCATFATDISSAESLGQYPVSRFSTHPAGRQCFKLDAIRTLAYP